MPDWQALFATARGNPIQPAVAHTFLRDWPSASRPVLLVCDDAGTDREFVVKGLQGGRQPVNDQIVGRLGIAAKAPVGAPALIDVPQALIDAQPELQHMPAGLAHGSRWLADCSERLAYEHAAEPQNRERFASLSLLFGWTHGNDHQFIYENAPPRLVHSVDHGHFFPGGPDWTAQSLTGAPAPAPDQTIVGQLSLTDADLDPLRPRFALADGVIAEAICAVPQAWGVPEADLLNLADFLASRRDILFPAP